MRNKRSSYGTLSHSFSKSRNGMGWKLKVAIIGIIVVVCAALWVLSLEYCQKKVIEIDAGGQVNIGLNYYNQVTKVSANDSNGVKILQSIDTQSSSPMEEINFIVNSSYKLGLLQNEVPINVLVESKDIDETNAITNSISEQLAKLSSDLGMNNPINQYQVTNKDYKVIQKIKKSTPYSSFDILENGFNSKTDDLYITSIIYKDDTFNINFSKNVKLSNEDNVTCAYGENTYEVTPVGYTSNSLIVSVSDFPVKTPLTFNVSTNSYENLSGVCIVPEIIVEEDEIDVSYEIDTQENRQALESLKESIINSDLTEQDKYNLLVQYDILLGYTDEIKTEEDLNNFKLIYKNLVNSFNSLTSDDYVEPNSAEDIEQQSFETIKQSYIAELDTCKSTISNMPTSDQKTQLTTQLDALYVELDEAKTQNDYFKFATDLSVFSEKIKTQQ